MQVFRRCSFAAFAQSGYRPAQPGNPLPGIVSAEFELFRIGLDDFIEVEDAGEGLGPAFNGLGCAQCHATPAIGGVSPVAEFRAGRLDAAGNFSVLGGDTLYHLFALPNQECQPAIPPDANVIARRIPIPLFGAGLVEAIPDDAIRALADPDDGNGDGVSGRAAVVVDVATGGERVGRFGWKAQHATLLAFGADAYRNEMGITNDLFPTETAAGIAPETLAVCDAVPDPEDRREPLNRPARHRRVRGVHEVSGAGRARPGGRGGRPRGSGIRIGGLRGLPRPRADDGPGCHPVFDRRPVPLYSDLLLHDVATGDGIAQGAAQPSERDPHAGPFGGCVSAGRCCTTETRRRRKQRCLRHGNEAAGAASRFVELPPDDRAALLAFLDSL